MSIFLLQENIELAKKDWELSHLQALREEEEKIAEEEAVEDIPLTYDRPDLCNKVTLRRSSTGMWKVCSSGQNHEPVVAKNKECQKLDSKETKNKRILRSGKSCSSEELKMAAVSVNGDLNSGPESKSIKHLKHVAVNRYTSRSLRNSTEQSGDCSSRTSGVLKSDESSVEWKDESDQQRDAVLNRKSSSCSPNGDSTLRLNANSAVGHKYPTRKKSAHHNNDSVL